MEKDEIINFNKFRQVILECGSHQLTVLLIVSKYDYCTGQYFLPWT